MAATIVLNNGQVMPTIGLGTYRSEPGQIERAIKDAIDCGYRHFDCGWIYGNEDEVAKAIHAKINEGVVTREDLFISNKLWNNFHKREHVGTVLLDSLRILELDYLDLFIIHWPLGFKEDARTLPVGESATAYSDVDYLETWQGMEDCVHLGLTRSIGLANFNCEQVERVLNNSIIKPAVNQVECNIHINQKKMIQFCKERTVTVIGYCPLGYDHLKSSDFPEPTIPDPKIREIAAKHNRTPAHVVLNYLINLGIAVVPKTVNKIRITEYINPFGFSLDPEDIAYLDSCNTNTRRCRFDGFRDHKYYPFELD